MLPPPASPRPPRRRRAEGRAPRVEAVRRGRRAGRTRAAAGARGARLPRRPPRSDAGRRRRERAGEARRTACAPRVRARLERAGRRLRRLRPSSASCAARPPGRSSTDCDAPSTASGGAARRRRASTRTACSCPARAPGRRSAYSSSWHGRAGRAEVRALRAPGHAVERPPSRSIDDGHQQREHLVAARATVGLAVAEAEHAGSAWTSARARRRVALVVRRAVSATRLVAHAAVDGRRGAEGARLDVVVTAPVGSADVCAARRRRPTENRAESDAPRDMTPPLRSCRATCPRRGLCSRLSCSRGDVGSREQAVARVDARTPRADVVLDDRRRLASPDAICTAVLRRLRPERRCSRTSRASSTPPVASRWRVAARRRAPSSAASPRARAATARDAYLASGEIRRRRGAERRAFKPARGMPGDRRPAEGRALPWRRHRLRSGERGASRSRDRGAPEIPARAMRRAPRGARRSRLRTRRGALRQRRDRFATASASAGARRVRRDGPPVRSDAARSRARRKRASTATSTRCAASIGLETRRRSRGAHGSRPATGSTASAARRAGRDAHRAARVVAAHRASVLARSAATAEHRAGIVPTSGRATRVTLALLAHRIACARPPPATAHRGARHAARVVTDATVPFVLQAGVGQHSRAAWSARRRLASSGGRAVCAPSSRFPQRRGWSRRRRADRRFDVPAEARHLLEGPSRRRRRAPPAADRDAIGSTFADRRPSASARSVAPSRRARPSPPTPLGIRLRVAAARRFRWRRRSDRPSSSEGGHGGRGFAARVERALAVAALDGRRGAREIRARRRRSRQRRSRPLFGRGDREMRVVLAHGQRRHRSPLSRACRGRTARCECRSRSGPDRATRENPFNEGGRCHRRLAPMSARELRASSVGDAAARGRTTAPGGRPRPRAGRAADFGRRRAEALPERRDGVEVARAGAARAAASAPSCWRRARPARWALDVSRAPPGRTAVDRAGRRARSNRGRRRSSPPARGGRSSRSPPPRARRRLHARRRRRATRTRRLGAASRADALRRRAPLDAGALGAADCRGAASRVTAPARRRSRAAPFVVQMPLAPLVRAGRGGGERPAARSLASTTTSSSPRRAGRVVDAACGRCAATSPPSAARRGIQRARGRRARQRRRHGGRARRFRRRRAAAAARFESREAAAPRRRSRWAAGAQSPPRPRLRVGRRGAALSGDGDLVGAPDVRRGAERATSQLPRQDAIGRSSRPRGGARLHALDARRSLPDEPGAADGARRAGGRGARGGGRARSCQAAEAIGRAPGATSRRRWSRLPARLRSSGGDDMRDPTVTARCARRALPAPRPAIRRGGVIGGAEERARRPLSARPPHAP